ncbi:hypothetical protein [Hymenobacter cheonanensis]|uniref:hypothetical protein n=1 Tax=Hymenobacter sp. CA2-7 TaxID=3063993 RepID=UPI0027137CF8|nr:hypothetical protein [Hymenobacter sp. CA2-7]MDO7883773.1 hypothetical protein [Hymenobacter sp. CA2-7]
MASTLAAGPPSGPVSPPSRCTHSSYWSPRRWRGTIGPQPVTLELDSGRWGYSGSYYYDHRGQLLRLGQDKPKQHQPITLSEGDLRPTGYWLVGSAVGPQLSGTWRSPDGRRSLPLALHETYTDAARYQNETWELTRYEAEEGNDHLDSAHYAQDYLRVYLPHNPVAEQRLRRALAPPVPAAHMPQLLDTLVGNRQSRLDRYYFDGMKLVIYNSNYLLSVVQLDRFTSPDETIGAGPREWWQGHTFDLRTGRPVQLADLLVPGYQARLRQLLRKELQAVWTNVHYAEVGRSGKLPAGGFVITATGLCFGYDDRDDEDLAYPGPYHADQEIEVEISYRDLLPLIRPTGPLAPVLQERGLLPRK